MNILLVVDSERFFIKFPGHFGFRFTTIFDIKFDDLSSLDDDIRQTISDNEGFDYSAINGKISY